MKSSSNNVKLLLAVMLLTAAPSLWAQQTKIQYLRPYDQSGINVFETSKNDTAGYDGFKLRIGGSFTQAYQGLNHENGDTTKAKKYALYPLGDGFNLAAANLNINAQLGDGIRVSLENYMASRHHNEFWVKGGYIQIDKLPMFGNPEWFTKYVTVKIGHMEINYGDSHFRRSDGGNSIYNAFADNNIMDAFATEIGGEVYVYPTNNVIVMVGLSNGLIRNNVRDYDKLPIYATNKVDSITQRSPSIYAKLVYDKAFNENLRVRLSGSVYNSKSSPSLTLFGGDRTGSHYFGVMELAATTNGTAEAFSGRFNPGLSNELTTFVINPFIKFKGLEIFGTYEQAEGRNVNDNLMENGKMKTNTRKTSQYAVDVTYRFLKNEQLFIAYKYNTVKSRLTGYTSDVTIDRNVVAAGWFPTKNLLLKGEYVTQKYNDFITASPFYKGKFDGWVIEAVVGF